MTSEKKIYIKSFTVSDSNPSNLEILDSIVNEWIDKNDIFVVDINTQVCGTGQSSQRHVLAFVKYQKLQKRKLLTEKV